MILQCEVYGTATDRQDRHYLGGTATLDGVTAELLVRMFERGSFLLVAATTSNPSTGAWSISHVNEYPVEGVYIIIFDPSGSANSVVMDWLSQVTF